MADQDKRASSPTDRFLGIVVPNPDRKHIPTVVRPTILSGRQVGKLLMKYPVVPVHNAPGQRDVVVASYLSIEHSSWEVVDQGTQTQAGGTYGSQNIPGNQTKPCGEHPK